MILELPVQDWVNPFLQPSDGEAGWQWQETSRGVNCLSYQSGSKKEMEEMHSPLTAHTPSDLKTSH